MPVFRTPIEKRIANRFKEIDKVVKNSFVLIRADIEEMQNSIEAMKKFLRSQDKQNNYARKEDNKIRAEFRRDVDEFSDKISQLRLTLEKAREIEKTVVVKAQLDSTSAGGGTDMYNLYIASASDIVTDGASVSGSFSVTGNIMSGVSATVAEMFAAPKGMCTNGILTIESSRCTS